MKNIHSTFDENTHTTNLQLYSLENNINNGHYSLNDIGDIVPGAIMVHDINALKVTYMNDWGCETLNHSKDEINAMGADYYEKFFVPEETQTFIAGLSNYYLKDDQSSIYSFFHRVKTAKCKEYEWYYAVCKFLRTNRHESNTSEVILIAHPVSGMGNMVKKVNKLLDENVFVSKNYKSFILLTKREKEIITLLAEGKSTQDVSDELFISSYTVSTHRKNISNKLKITSFTELLRFAAAFELIK